MNQDAGGTLPADERQVPIDFFITNFNQCLLGISAYMRYSVIAEIMKMRKAVIDMAGDFNGNSQTPVE